MLYFVLIQLKSTTSDEELRQLMTGDSSDIIYDSGFAIPVNRVRVDDIPDIMKAVCLHTTVLAVKAELDQMAEGLALSLQVLLVS